MDVRTDRGHFVSVQTTVEFLLLFWACCRQDRFMSSMLRRRAGDLSMELGSGRQELGVTAKQASKPLSIQGATNIAVGVDKSVALAALAVNEDITNANVSLPRRTRERKNMRTRVAR